jgi:Fe2+ or Zn2+ uptake regulation protein
MINLVKQIVVCDKCGRVIDEHDQIWFLNQMAGYSSELDGEELHKEFCDGCLMEFIGE